jgi:hypothetical protein
VLLLIIVVIVLVVLLMVNSVALFFVARELHWTRLVIEWTDERELIFSRIYREAEVVGAVGNHVGLKEGAGGNMAYEGTLLNYDTLKVMVKNMQEQEQDRREYTAKLNQTLAELMQWEKDHPVPPPPTLLHRRVPIPL